MPKFTAEIDTDEKTTKFTIDGKEVDVSEFNMCKYVSYGYISDVSACVSYGNVDYKSGERTSKNISFDKYGVSTSESNRSVASAAYKAVANINAGEKLEKIFTKDKKV